ncbi:MAG: tetratricopeptide repeat protein [Rhizomicrobium sp.]
MTSTLRLMLFLTLFLVAEGTAGGAGAADAPQATSLFGRPLYTPAPSPETLAKYQAAKDDYEADTGNADKLIWYGRRAAYAGRFDEAIRIYSEGVRRFPQDARILRHRGHRYITTRQFDKAIADFEKAHALIAGKKDEIEPDGAPNARGIPVSTLNGNIRYHLGLAYYLKHDWKKALRLYDEEVRLADNDDRRIAASYWVYQILRRMGEEGKAAAFLKTVPKKPDLIENEAYWRVLRLDKGEITEAEAQKDGAKDPSGVAVAYGVANYHLFGGDKEGAFKRMNDILETSGWADFGYIAAESDLAFYKARTEK